MTDSRKDALGPEQASSQHTPVPKEILQRIFGTSHVFQNFDDIKPTVSGLTTVPLKVGEYYCRGHQCLEKEDWELAVLLFSRALHLNSELVEFYALRAEAYIQLCDFSSATQNLRRAYSFQPENTSYLERLTFVLYLQGQCLFEQCAFLDALNIFSQASELQPEKACIRYRCMACLLALQRHRDCLSLVTTEVNQGTSNADIYILRAKLYNFFQKPRLCYHDLHSALLLDPKHPRAKALLKIMVDRAQKSYQDASILAVQGKLQHALQCVNHAIENNPLDPSLFLFRGTMYRRLRDFDAAVEDFLMALDMMPALQEDLVQQTQRQLLLTYNDFAVHCYMQGAYQESVLLLNKALKAEQQEKGLYINRGDCFFQLGNLTFAQADYEQALELNPQDEGAHLRMGLLQEKMGFCEQRSRQFQKAESHFSVAIQHNPQRAQCYVHRARCRQLMHNIFGAHQDVATALLLNPKQPKLFQLMTNLFPGLTVEEVLSSQVAHLARLQLSRVVEDSLQNSIPRGIMGQLRKRELERQKAQALRLSWKLGQALSETSEKLHTTPQTLQEEPGSPEAKGPEEEEEEEAKGPEEEEEEEAKGPEEEEKAKGPEEEEQEEEQEQEQEKPESAPSEARSLSDSYLDETSSGSLFGFRTPSTSETETSTICQEYRSTSATTVAFSDSSPLRTPSSDLENSREDLSLTRSPRKIKAGLGQSRRASKMEAAWGPSQSPSLSQRPSITEATQGQGPRPKPKTKATQRPRQRLRKAKAAHGRSWGPSKAAASWGQSWGLIRSSSKTKTFYDPSWSPSSTQATQSQGQQPSKTKVTQGLSQNSSTSSHAAL